MGILFFNLRGVYGFLVALALAIPLSWAASEAGWLPPGMSGFDLGVVLYGLFSALYGFTVDRSEKFGLLEGYGGLLAGFRPFTKATLKDYRPARRMAVFGLPSVLMPWLIAVLLPFLTYYKGKGGPEERLAAALALAVAGVVAIVASVIYGLATRKLRWVPPEKAGAMQAAFKEAVLAAEEGQRSLLRSPEHTADPSQRARLFSPKAYLLTVSPGLLLLVAGLGLMIALDKRDKSFVPLLMPAAGVLWTLIATLTMLALHKTVTCPWCERMVRYRRRDDGKVLVCHRCDFAWRPPQ
jgi:hypothetical protein